MKSSRFPLLVRIGEQARRLRLERWTVISVTAAFVIALVIVLATTQSQSFSLGRGADSWEAGVVAEKDYVVERDFQYVDEKATQAKRDAREKLVPPVYTINAVVTASTLDTFDRFTQTVMRLVKQGTTEDKLYLRLQIDFPDRLERTDLRLLLSSRDLNQTLEAARSLLDLTLSRGVVDLLGHRTEAGNAGAIEIRRTVDGRVQSEETPLEQVVTADNVQTQMDARARERTSSDLERRIQLMLLGAFVAPNAFYDSQATQTRVTRARADVDPVTEKLARGQILVRRGDIVSDDVALKIHALGQYAKTVDINGIIGSALFLLIAFIVALYLLSLKTNGVPFRRGHSLLLLGMGLCHLLLSALVVRLIPLPDWVPAAVAIPTSAMVMLVAILVSTSVGIYFCLAVSLGLLLLTGMGIQGFLFAFLSGVAATAVVLDTERRIDLVRAGLFLALADLLILTVLGLLANYDPRMIFSLLAWGIANGFLCGILALGFLPVFELALNAPTRFKLMELSDLNSPIFRRMLSQAPGTYAHSISVANLAETACEAIGANPLLARVSAYYHDIGKVDQADYFAENQKAFNRHDDLKPSLSVAVIKSHVRIGIEKARELNLPQAIIDIIAQHHGHGLITYFYHRAVKEGRNARVSRDDYSYPGARPKTKEAAVLLLADSAEAASRTLKRPTEARLDKFVQELIMSKFNAGELGDSNLTLRDLEQIRRSFVHVLGGYYHTRIEYPKVAQVRGGGAG